MDPRVCSELKVVEVVNTNWLPRECTCNPGKILTIIYVIGSYRSQTENDFLFAKGIYKAFFVVETLE
jgi:hypothetical protein